MADILRTIVSNQSRPVAVSEVTPSYASDYTGFAQQDVYRSDALLVGQSTASKHRLII